jgi:hypothetical protein
MQFLEISWDFGILEFSKILGFFQRFLGIFDEVYEDFQSNLPLVYYLLFPINYFLKMYRVLFYKTKCHRVHFSVFIHRKWNVQNQATVVCI